MCLDVEKVVKSIFHLVYCIFAYVSMKWCVLLRETVGLLVQRRRQHRVADHKRPFVERGRLFLEVVQPLPMTLVLCFAREEFRTGEEQNHGEDRDRGRSAGSEEVVGHPSREHALGAHAQGKFKDLRSRGNFSMENPLSPRVISLK